MVQLALLLLVERALIPTLGTQLKQEITHLAQNLCVGPYSIVIEDANGCSIDTTVSVGGPPGIVITSVDATEVLCNGDCNGSITINATDASEI